MIESTDVKCSLRRIEEEVREARIAAGMDPAGVDILAVTKTRPVAVVQAAITAGLTHIGENRVAELESKVEAVGRTVARWHLIGHLQRNKVRQALPLFDLLHSLDSLRLARKISSEAVELECEAHVLVQVNTSGEESKYGFSADEALDAVAEICELSGLQVDGLMTMAPLTDDEKLIRETFRAARGLYEQSRGTPGFNALHLSMGMSNDYRIAVEEGSTLVRLGTVLFGGREV